MAPSPYSLPLEFTVVSATDLKNVNWRNGDLRAYASIQLNFNIDDRVIEQPLCTKLEQRPRTTRIRTVPDYDSPTSPPFSWREESILLSVDSEHHDNTSLSIHIFHAPGDPQELSTVKPLVGSATVSLSDIIGKKEEWYPFHPSRGREVFEEKMTLVRPSGRPQGELCVHIIVGPRPPVLRPPGYNLAWDYNWDPFGSHPRTPTFNTGPCAPGHHHYAFDGAYPPPPPRPSLGTCGMQSSSAVGAAAREHDEDDLSVQFQDVL